LEAIRFSAQATSSMAVNKQPEPGDILLGCAHAPDPHDGAHIFRAECVLFRPNGKNERSKWIVLCDACFQEHVVRLGGRPSDASLAFEVVWGENEPPLVFEQPS